MNKLSNIGRLSESLKGMNVNIFDEMRDSCPAEYFPEVNTCGLPSPTDIDCFKCWTEIPNTYVKRKENYNGFETRCLDCDSNNIDVIYEEWEFTYFCKSCGQSQ